MKRILLINPPFNISKTHYNFSISVGLLSMASYLAERKVPVHIVDCARERDYQTTLRKEVPKADIIGFSVMTTQTSPAMVLSKFVRTLNPRAHIIWGGSHPTFFPEDTVQSPLVDSVGVGEGEKTLLALALDEPNKKVPGLVWMNATGVQKNPRAQLLEKSDFPAFKWDLIPSAQRERIRLVPTLTSRGCPHRCAFCINAIQRIGWRAKTPDAVLSDLEDIVQRSEFKGKPIRFWDENFFVDIKRARKILEEMIARNLTLAWETTIRADYFREGQVDDDFLAKLKASGCYLLAFGAESGSPRILKKIAKDLHPKQVLNAAKQCLKFGIIPQFSFMIGLPGEKRTDMLATVDLIRRLLRRSSKIQILGPQAFRPYPGSKLYQECIESGWKAPQSLEEWADLSKKQLSYLSVQDFPWVEEKSLAESLEVYVRFGAHPLRESIKSTTKSHPLLKLGFIGVCKIRWFLRFFSFPLDYALAKRFVAKP